MAKQKFQKKVKPSVTKKAESVEVKKVKEDSFLSKFFVPHNIFLIFGLFFGVLFGITTPPFQVPDESVHMFRAYQLSEFRLRLTTNGEVIGDTLPSNLTKVASSFSYLAFNPRNKVNSDSILNKMHYNFNKDHLDFTYISASNYSYLNYLPQMPAVFIAKALNLNILPMLYLGRFFGLLFFLICGFLAIKYTPVIKHYLLVLALLPNTLSLSASFSPDCVNSTFAILAVSLFLQLYFSDEIRLNDKRLWLLLVVVMLFGILKPVYTPISLLLFLLPYRKISSPKIFWSIAGANVIISILLSLAWLKIVGIYTYANTEGFSALGINPSAQIKLMLADPFKFLKVIQTSLKYYWTFYTQSLVGILGYLDTRLPQWIYTTFNWLILFVMFFDFKADRKIAILTKIGAFILSIGIIVAVFMAVHIYGEVGSEIINGIQGRYFIPAIFLFGISVNNIVNLKFEIVTRKWASFLIYLLLFVLLYNSELALYSRYFLKYR